MRDVVMREGRISELIVNHDQRQLMVNFGDGNIETFVVNDDVKIMNDEHFVLLGFDALAVRLPVYVYSDKKTAELLFVIIAQNEDNLFQIIDVFDHNLVNSNQMLKINDTYLNLVKDSHFNAPVRAMLSNQQLLVFYHVSTKSIPALINPVKIIIL